MRAWPAPAKLNLFLHITGRRPDGYHLLQTVFQFLDYGDELYFHVQANPKIRRVNDLPGIPEDQDLIIRAARLLRQTTGIESGVEIEVNKRIPAGGGLGGGSSNAATTLVALNELWGAGLSIDELSTLGLSLGADVPVFVRGNAAWAEGVGDLLTPVEPHEDWYLVLTPSIHVSTEHVFSHPDLTRNTLPITISDFLSGAGKNDCEEVVFADYPAVQEARNWLSKYGDARMTGTGACVYAPYKTEQKAQEVLVSLPAGWNAFIAKGLNRSPLMDRLEQERQG